MQKTVCKTYFSEFVFISDWWAGVQYYFYAKKEDYEYFGKEHALSIVNHKYEIDWLCPWVIHDRIGNLGVSSPFTDKNLRLDSSKPLMFLIVLVCRYGINVLGYSYY